MMVVMVMVMVMVMVNLAEIDHGKALTQMMKRRDPVQIYMFSEYLQKYQFSKFPAQSFPFSFFDNRERASNGSFANKYMMIK